MLHPALNLLQARGLSALAHLTVVIQPLEAIRRAIHAGCTSGDPLYIAGRGAAHPKLRALQLSCFLAIHGHHVHDIADVHMIDPLLILLLKGVNLKRRLLPDGRDRGLGQPQDTTDAEEFKLLRVPNLLKVLVCKKLALEVHIGKRLV